MTDRIEKAVDKLVNKYNTVSPKELCDFMNIRIIKCDLPNNINGFFMNNRGQIIIVIDNDLNDVIKNKVIAHELGHIVLHNNLNIASLKLNTYMYPQKFEKEADIFATYLLLKNENINYDYDSMTIDNISSLIGISVEIINICLYN